MKVCNKCKSEKVTRRFQVQQKGGSPKAGSYGWGVIKRGDLCKECFKLFKEFMNITIPDTGGSDD